MSDETRIRTIINQNIHTAMQEAQSIIPIDRLQGAALTGAWSHPNNTVIRLDLQTQTNPPSPLYFYTAMMGPQVQIDLMREEVARLAGADPSVPPLTPPAFSQARPGGWIHHATSAAKSKDRQSLVPLSVLSLLAPGFTPILHKYGHTHIDKLGEVFALHFSLEMGITSDPVASITLILADNNPGIIVSIDADQGSVYALTVGGSVGPVQ